MKLLVLCTDTWNLPYWAPSSISEKKEQFQPLCIQRKRACGQARKRLFPQWGCWSSLVSFSAELHFVCFNFWWFAAAVSSGPSCLKGLVSFQCLTMGPFPSWNDCGASQQHPHKGAVAEPELLGSRGRTARQSLAASTGRSAVPWFATPFLENRINKRLFNSDHSKVLWKHVAAVFKVFVGGGCWHVRLCLILQGLRMFCKNCKCKYLAIVSYPSSPSPSGIDDAGLLYCV